MIRITPSGLYRTTYCVAVYLNRAEQLSEESSPSDLSPTNYLFFHAAPSVCYLWLAVLCITKHIHDNMAIFGMQVDFETKYGLAKLDV